MSFDKERNNQPSEAEFLTATTAVVNQLSLNNLDEVLAKWRTQASPSFMQELSEISEFAAPIDRDLGHIDKENMNVVKRALGVGGLIGLQVTRKAFDPFAINSKDIFDRFAVPGVDPNAEPLDILNAAAVGIRELGGKGLAAMGDAAENAIEDIEGLIISDVRQQRLVRIGAGVIVAIVSSKLSQHIDARTKAELEAFRSELSGAHDADWDSGLMDLLNGPKF